MAPRNIITETTAEAYMAQVLGPKLETIEENIVQTKLDQIPIFFMFLLFMCITIRAAIWSLRPE